jgi:hypothetical protein
MKPMAKVFASLFSSEPLDPETARRRQIHREWDRQRAAALTPAEREEIDAIFSRNL